MAAKEYELKKYFKLKYFLMKFPPILTLERKLGNLKRESKNEFVYKSEGLNTILGLRL